MQMNRIVIADYVSKTAEARHLLPALLRGRERPIRGWQQGNTGTHNSHSLSFYGKLADVGQALKKGDNIYIDGRLEQRKFIGCDAASRVRRTRS